MERTIQTNYYVATHWLHNHLILCNEIAELDESVYENLNGLDVKFDDDGDETIEEIYQWFLTDCNEDDVQWLQEHFGLLFTYSEKLDLYVLCVTHYGTSWDYVYWTTDIENAKAEEGNKLGL